MNERCERYELMISRKLDGDLSEAEERELRAHLRECPSCRELARALAAVTKAARAGEAEPPAELASGVMDRIETYADAPRRAPASKPWKKTLIAACLVLVIGVGGFAAWRAAQPKGSSAAVKAAEAEEAVMEAPAAAEPEAAAFPPAPMPEPEMDGGSNYAGGPGEDVPAEAAQDSAAGADLSALERYTVDSPARVPAGSEEAFEALLTDAGVTPGETRETVAYVEYRGIIYEFSLDGGALVWRDAAEGMPHASRGTAADLAALLG